MDKEEILITSEEAGTRIDKFLSERLPEHTRSFYQKAIEEQKILVNDSPVKNNYKLKSGDSATVLPF